MVGSIFLWMYWPSFNSALATGATRHRIMNNTALGIIGSVMSAAATARVLFGKLDMEIMLNATLAGGVAIGTSSDLVCEPSSAMIIGMIGGILSAVGFARIGPWLADSGLNLQDTCGVHSLHGMPGVLGGLASICYLMTLEGKGFPKDYFPITKEGGDYSAQAAAQFKALLCTLCLSILSGVVGGTVCGFDMWCPVHALFREDDHFTQALQKYPKEYLENTDEAIEYGKQALYDIRDILKRIIPADSTSEGEKMAWMEGNVWEVHARTS